MATKATAINARRIEEQLAIAEKATREAKAAINAALELIHSGEDKKMRHDQSLSAIKGTLALASSAVTLEHNTWTDFAENR